MDIGVAKEKRNRRDFPPTPRAMFSRDRNMDFKDKSTEVDNLEETR